MDDRTARAAHWLSSGRSAALVAPAVRMATSPATRDAMDRAREVADTLSEIDVDRARRIAVRLRDDRDFRRGVTLAATRVQDAVEESRRRRRTWLWALAALALIGAIAGIAAMRRGGGTIGGEAGHRQDDAVRPAGSPYTSGAPAG